MCSSNVDVDLAVTTEDDDFRNTQDTLNESNDPATSSTSSHENFSTEKPREKPSAAEKGRLNKIRLQTPPRPAKIIKSGKRKNVSTGFESAVDKLHDIAQLTTDTEDEYDKFGKHIAAQLRQLPVRNFIILQEKMQSLITAERLACMEGSSSVHSHDTVQSSEYNTHNSQQEHESTYNTDGETPMYQNSEQDHESAYNTDGDTPIYQELLPVQQNNGDLEDLL